MGDACGVQGRWKMRNRNVLSLFSTLGAALVVGALIVAASPAIAQHKRPGSASTAHLRQGYKYEQANNLDAALNEYNLAIKADRGNPEGYFSRAELFRTRKQYDKAIDCNQTGQGYGRGLYGQSIVLRIDWRDRECAGGH